MGQNIHDYPTPHVGGTLVQNINGSLDERTATFRKTPSHWKIFLPTNLGNAFLLKSAACKEQRQLYSDCAFLPPITITTPGSANKPTRESLRELHVESTISNSKSSSGNVVTAGHIWSSTLLWPTDISTFCHFEKHYQAMPHYSIVSPTKGLLTAAIRLT